MSFSGALMCWRSTAFTSIRTYTRRRLRVRHSTASCADSLLRRGCYACSTKCGKTRRATARSTRLSSRCRARRGSCAPSRCHRQRLVVRAETEATLLDGRERDGAGGGVLVGVSVFSCHGTLRHATLTCCVHCRNGVHEIHSISRGIATNHHEHLQSINKFPRNSPTGANRSKREKK